MNSITLTLTVDTPELAKQLVDLAAGIVPAAVPQPAAPQQFVAPAPMQVQPPQVYPQPVPVQPAQSYVSIQPPVAPAAPVQAPVMATAPVAPPPTYDYETLARAASTLMDTGKQQELLGLLKSFNISALPQLPKERSGEFATALRGLGAQI